MMTLNEAANRFHKYLLREHPNGLSVVYLVANSKRLSGVERSDILKIVTTYSNKFEVRKGEDDVFVIGIGSTASSTPTSTVPQPTAPTITNKGSGVESTTETPKDKKMDTKKIKLLRKNRVQKIAKDFYDEVLKDNPFLRQRCEDRNVFNEEYITWKEKVASTGTRNLTGSNPSTILTILKSDLKIVDVIVKSQFIVWRDKPDTRDQNRARNMSRQARIQDVINKVQNCRKQLEQNRNGIEIEPITFGLDINSVARIRTEIKQQVKIMNKSQDAVKIVVKDQLAFKRGFTVTLPEIARNKTFSIERNSSISMDVSYTPHMTGLTKCILTFEATSPAFDPFVIVRYISVNSGDPDDFSITKPSAPFERKKAPKRDAFLDPERIKQYNGSNHSDEGQPFKYLKHYRIQRDIRKSIENESILDEVIALFFKGRKLPDEEISSDLSDKLNIRNYRAIFERLLWLEEFTMERDIQTYDMEKVPLERKGISKYSIHVPGLAESRPSGK